LESLESIVTILLKAFGGLSIKSFVWGSLLLCMPCHAKFVAFLEKSNEPIICLRSVE
jgi:hypothetical protein